MATVGDVVVKLEANASSFNKAMTEARGKTEQMSKALGSVGKAMTVGLTAPIGIATAALGGMILSTMNAADQILLLSQKSGLSTQGIQELTFAGNLAGVSIETMATASAMLTRNLVDAANGVGEAKDTVEQLGLKLRDSNGAIKSQQDLFNLTLDSLSKMSNETEQAAAAMELFGRGGKEMLPLLKTFTGGFEEVRAEAEKMGLVMSEDTIRALDLLDDTLSTRLPGAFRGATNAIVGEFLPAIETQLIPFVTETAIPAIHGFADVIIDIMKWFNSFSTPVKLAAATLVGLAAAAGPALLAISALMPVFVTLATVVLPVVKAKLIALVVPLMGISAPVWIVIGAVTALGLAWAYFSKEIIGGVASAIDFMVYDSFNNMIRGINSVITATNELLGTSFGTFEERVKPAVTVGDKFAETMNGMDDGIRTFASGLVFAAEDMAGFIEKTEETVTAAEGAAARLVPETLKKKESVDTEDIDKSLSEQDLKLKALPIKTKKALTESQKAWNEYFQALTPMQKLGSEAISKMGNTIGDMNFSFKSFKDTLKNLRGQLKGFFMELLRMAAKKAVMKIIDTLTGGTGVGGGLAGAGLGMLGKFGKMFGFAKGGIIKEPTAMIGMRSGGLGIMAESGPEAIIPMGTTRSGGRMGDVFLTVNVYGSVGIEDIGEKLVGHLRTKGII